jgi:tetratricopeptide (TPR) repeat protein
LSTETRTESSPGTKRLEAWKEIAAYLNRSERTVRRWEEKEGLPIHRLQHDKRGSVYAYANELDAWRESRRQLVDAEPADAAEAGSNEPPSSLSRRRPSRPLIVGAITIAVLAIGMWVLRRSPGLTPHPDALRAFKQAEYGSNAGRTQIQSGIHYYQEAIRIDPRFADAWTGLATAHFAQTWFSESPAKTTMAQAKREAERAMMLDPGSAAPLRVLAAIEHYHRWDHASAERLFRQSIDRDASGVALSWFSEFLIDLRRFDEAAQIVKRAQDVVPRWLEPMTVSGNIHLFTGHPELAIAEYQRALAIEPNFGLANHFLGRAYLAIGEHDRALAQLRRSHDLMGQVPFTMGDLGYSLAVAGARAEAERLVADLQQRREREFYPAYPIAAILMGLGRTDAALDWLERAVDEQHLSYYLPSVEPMFDPIRSHPRFQALLRRLNLEL